MAVYFQNTLVASSDFIRITRRYSSAQSLSRAHKNGHQYVVSIDRMRFVPTMPDTVAALYSVKSWEGLALINGSNLPGDLTALRRIGKKIKLGETLILSWALLNRMDVYWIAGRFFAKLHAAEEIAKTEQKHAASFTKPPKVRRSRLSHK